MAKISSYPSDSNVSLSDKLIGTDAESNNATKNFTVGSMLDLADDPTVLTGFVPYTGATGNVNLGGYDISADTVSGDVIFADTLFEGNSKLTSYASAISLVPQVQTNVGVAKIVEFETELFSDTATVSANLITFNAIGRYMIEVTARVEHTSGGGDAVLNFWLQYTCLLYTSPSPRDRQKSRMPSSA